MKTCPTCGTEYPVSERFCPKDGSALRSTDVHADLVGQVVAERYHVLQKLGEGGMGQVYLAEHVRMARRCAVKVMSPNLTRDPDAVSRFNREAANASRITHPNVAAIYDFGETSDGLIYLAMEFVDGEPLTKLIQRLGALPLARAVTIARQTADALTVAHELGIVHRDLKPDNIMIGRGREGADMVKVVDFGIAKASQNEAQKVTKTGLVVGTPEYMSPEQLAGDKLDGRSDVYSLGLVTFVMLTGKLPFPSETAQEAMLMRLMEKPKTLAEMRPDLAFPPGLQAVFDKVLARDMTQRYAVAADFGADLVRAAQAGGVAVPRQSPYGAVTTAMDAMAVGKAGAASTVPATRVAPAVEPPTLPRGPGGAEGPSAPPPSAAPRKRTGLMVGISAAALLVAGGTAFVLATNSHGATKPPIVQKDTTTPVSTTPASTPPTNDTVATVPTKPKPKLPARRDSSHVVATRPAVDSTASPAALIDRIESLLAPGSRNEANANEALGLTSRVLPTVTDSKTRAEVLFDRADALVVLNKHSEACGVLKSQDMQQAAANNRWADAVSNVIQEKCQ
ncbi:MAG TPA: protein kinase [Gemmatimonadaceae bacterium]|nr:protein kinase [Gemmatimonadaceae bacterium]